MKALFAMQLYKRFGTPNMKKKIDSLGAMAGKEPQKRVNWNKLYRQGARDLTSPQGPRTLPSQ
jgi:hypothetical protein